MSSTSRTRSGAGQGAWALHDGGRFGSRPLVLRLQSLLRIDEARPARAEAPFAWNAGLLEVDKLLAQRWAEVAAVVAPELAARGRGGRDPGGLVPGAERAGVPDDRRGRGLPLPAPRDAAV